MKRILFLTGLCFLLVSGSAAAFTEPIMADYTSTPVFMPETVPPNIMIVLDNSGSMNEPAYDETYAGEPYASDTRWYSVVSTDDDVEEENSAGDSDAAQTWDLDMGEGLVGLRFTGINISQGAVVQAAYIVFTAVDSDSVTTDLVIDGEDSDNALPFDTDDPDAVKNRTGTGNSVSWSAIPAWTSGTEYNSPDLTAIVQEIIDRPGWAAGNAMVFRIDGSGERDAAAMEYGSTTKVPKLYIDIEGNQGKLYYGLFNPNYIYSYGNNIFTAAYKKIDFDYTNNQWSALEFFPEGGSDSNGAFGSEVTLNATNMVSNALWDGNWANWLCMRRIDVLRKVLVGGYSQSRQGGGKQTNLGDIPDNNVHSETFNKDFDSSSVFPVNPYNSNKTYHMEDGNIEVVVVGTDPSYTIKIQKEPVIEPEDFTVEGELGGVLQRIDDKARWGNIWFNDGESESGGSVRIPIEGADMSALISMLQNESCKTRTPLAETMYVAMQYFKQEEPESGLDYPNDAVPINRYGGKDPYYDADAKEIITCAKSFVILLTDGASTADSKIPDFLKDTDGDGDAKPSTDTGTDFLDDVAFYARTNDLRTDLDGEQNLILYTIYAFDDTTIARQLLKDAAKNGGFEDRNGNKEPDLQVEWDKNGDNIPDTYFEATDGYALERQLLNAITDILKRASSGTAASVLATNNQGSGNSVQAYFKPVSTVGMDEARWLGYMQSVWVDPWGNLREDTDGDLNLDLRNTDSTNTAGSDVDLIVEFFSNGDETKLRRFTKHYLYNPAHGNEDTCDAPEDCTVESEILNMDENRPLFEAGSRLAAMDPDDRNIFTYIDSDTDGVVDSGEVIAFNAANSSALAPYLGVQDTATWGDSGARLGAAMADRVSNIITWVRGTDVGLLRNRTLDGVTWRLGDIINSTPMMVGLPKEYYHQLYQDLEYLDFIRYCQDRETVIYVGANDGMMHAFTNWLGKKDNAGNIWYEKPSGAGAGEQIGDEIWAFIPQTVLPHLKWTAQQDYTHSYYVNGPPRVFDAKILADDTYYTDSDTNPNFGTFMVFGLNMGGKEISVYEDFGSGDEERTFYPTYILLDITNPRSPKVMWERTYEGLGMSTVTPSPVHIGPQDGTGDWYLVFGSGPTDYDGISTQNGRFFVVDMATGAPIANSGGTDWLWKSAKKSYLNEPLVLDLFQSHDANTIFFADNYSVAGWQADVYKVAIPCTKCIWDTDENGAPKYTAAEVEYDADPNEWKTYKFFESPGPVSVQLSSTVDPLGNLLVYFGTGRFLSQDDKSDTDQQYLYCVKDPFYNVTKYEDDYYTNFDDVNTLSTASLFDSGSAKSTIRGRVTGLSGGDMDFWDFVEKIREEEDGWYLKMDTTGAASERVVTQTSILAGVAITPVFTPAVDLCGAGGTTSLIGVYYETGTGYQTQLFDIATPETVEITVDGETVTTDVVAIRDDDSYAGMPAPKAPFHVGSEGGARISTQVGTGEFVNIKTDPSLYIGSIITEWWDEATQAIPMDPQCSDW